MTLVSQLRKAAEHANDLTVGQVQTFLDNAADALAAALPPPEGDVGGPLTKEQLNELLARPSPEFDAWRDRMPDDYWARYDLSAAKLGWLAALSRQLPAPTGEVVAWRWRWGRLGHDTAWSFSATRPGPFAEDGYVAEPLYATPVVAGEPSDQLIYAMNRWTDEHPADPELGYSDADMIEFYKLIVAAAPQSLMGEGTVGVKLPDSVDPAGVLREDGT